MSEKKSMILRLSDKELAQLKQFAKEDNISVNEYIRRRLFEDTDNKNFSNCTKFEKKALELLFKLIANTNGISNKIGAEAEVKDWIQRANEAMKKDGIC